VALLTRHALLIVNPASRKGARRRAAAQRAFERAGVHCEVVETSHPWHARELAEQRKPAVDAVFTLGGDGTVMEVVSALAHTGVPIGVLPGGTGNLIAQTLRVPSSMRRAVPALLGGDLAQVDLGRIGDRKFVFAAGVGVDAVMIEQTSRRLKARFGVLAYCLTFARAALRHERFTVITVVDGVRTQREATTVMVANFGTLFRDLLHIGPGIVQDDGMLDLCVFSPGTVRDALRIVWRLVRKDFRADPCMWYTAGRCIRIETIPPRQLQADGDLLGMTPFDVSVEPLAAHLLVPRLR
jgi:diacylglycerol kinase (ATP)